MKRYALFLVFAALAAPALADTYQVNFGWTDPTTYIPSDTPLYEAKYRIDGGAETVIPNLTTPGGSTSLTAPPGTPIDMAVRACNQTLCSTWTGWVTATAGYPPTQPQTQTGLTITITRAGP